MLCSLRNKSSEGASTGCARPDWAADVIVDLLQMTSSVRKLFANGGHEGPSLRNSLRALCVSSLIEIAEERHDVKEFSVPYRRWPVEPTLPRIDICRRLAHELVRQ